MPAQLSLLFSSFILMSIGSGVIGPCSLAFGADQFKGQDNPKKERIDLAKLFQLVLCFGWALIYVGTDSNSIHSR